MYAVEWWRVLGGNPNLTPASIRHAALEEAAEAYDVLANTEAGQSTESFDAGRMTGYEKAAQRIRALISAS